VERRIACTENVHGPMPHSACVLFEKLKSSDPVTRGAATAAIGDMLAMAPELKHTNIKSQIRAALLQSTKDTDPNVRITGVTKIAMLHDPTVRQIVERIAREDPYKTSEEGLQIFPAREAAKRALEQWNQ
jgi:hypothetical protein